MTPNELPRLYDSTSAEAATETGPVVVHTRAELQQAIDRARAARRKIGVVPTMGALHAGHVSLVETACQDCDFVIVTIFVNPTQFGPQEDFQKYPRTLAADLAQLAPWPVDVVYAPRDEEVYPSGYATFVEAAGAALPLEGERRPGHFRGVATVVLKLFQQTQADVAYFGQKDYQQTCVVRQMARDFDLPVRIQVCPTVREADGLALSSRNVYLSDQERRQALVLSRSLRLATELVAAGEKSTAVILKKLQALYDAEPSIKLEYLTIVDPETLVAATEISARVVALVAARVGATRLIDNVIIDPVVIEPNSPARPVGGGKRGAP
jgi:pantoate--beta-alanine ligase